MLRTVVPIKVSELWFAVEVMLVSADVAAVSPRRVIPWRPCPRSPAAPGFAKGSAMMPEPDRDEKRTARGRASSVRKRGPSDEPMDEVEMDEEEKILAGRPDANMPALLTKDVPGG
jgi:hypothetical protein